MAGRLVLGVCVLCCALLAAAHDSHAQSIDPNHYYRIVSHLSNKCIDVDSFGVTSGIRLQQWECGPTAQPNQLWNILPAASGGYRIVSAGSAKCIDVKDASTTNGQKLQQYTCELTWDQWNQVFYISPGPTAGWYHIASTQSGGTECFDVEAFSTANGTNIQQWACGPLSNQEWQFVDAGPRTPVSHIQAYGYHWSRPVSTWSNMRDHSNLGEISDTSELPNVAAQAPVKVKFDVDFFVYAPKQGGDIWSNGPSDGGLKANYVDLWNAIKTQIKNLPAYDYTNQIGMFYISDEPVWRFNGKGFSPGEIYQMIQMTTDMIKADFPTIPIAIVEGFPVVGGPDTPSYPPSVNWVGFDCYICSWDDYENRLNVLASKLTDVQRLLVVPKAYYVRPYDPAHPPIANADEEADLFAQVEPYMTIALKNWKVVGVLPFLGNTQVVQEPDGPKYYGGLYTTTTTINKWKFLMRALGFGAP